MCFQEFLTGFSIKKVHLIEILTCKYSKRNTKFLEILDVVLDSSELKLEIKCC